VGLGQTEHRFSSLLDDFHWVGVGDVLAARGDPIP
jgi:hypothetical protein